MAKEDMPKYNCDYIKMALLMLIYCKKFLKEPGNKNVCTMIANLVKYFQLKIYLI